MREKSSWEGRREGLESNEFFSLSKRKSSRGEFPCGGGGGKGKEYEYFLFDEENNLIETSIV